jgi:hypothetical protein
MKKSELLGQLQSMAGDPVVVISAGEQGGYFEVLVVEVVKMHSGVGEASLFERPEYLNERARQELPIEEVIMLSI